jgi:hypothetical protein
MYVLHSELVFKLVCLSESEYIIAKHKMSFSCKLQIQNVFKYRPPRSQLCLFITNGYVENSPRQVHKMGQVVVEVGERDPVLRPDGLTDDDLVDVVELVPVVVQGGGVFNEGLVLGSSRNGDVQSLGREERLEVEQVEVVVVHKVSHQLKIRDVYE